MSVLPRGSLLPLSLSLFAIVLTGCAPAPSLAPTPNIEVIAARKSDLNHLVESKTETWETIAAWYTGSADNSTRIARINDRSLKEKLAPGERIRIPSYLLVRSEKLATLNQNPKQP